MRRVAFFLFLSVFVSGCAGSGGGSGVASQQLRPPSGGSPFATTESDGYETADVFGFRYHESDPPDIRRQEDEETNPYLLPAVAVPDPDSDAKLSDLPPARALDRAYLIPAESPCDVFFQDYINRRANSMEPCNRARIPGLTPLYDMVSANIAELEAAGESFPQTGVVIDGLNCEFLEPTRELCKVSAGPDHGAKVVETANAAAPRALFRYSEVTVFKTDTVDKFQELASASGLVANPVVNISQAHLFKTADNTSDDLGQLINHEDISAVGALVVASTGNYGPKAPVRVVRNLENPEGIQVEGANTVLYPGASIELRTTPYQPAHDPAALREIHEETGSLLLVAGLETEGLPRTDENGFHLGYFGAISPVIHGESNRCGDARNYCVAAPYQIYKSATQRSNRLYNVGGYRGTSFAAPLVSGTLMNLRHVWPHLTNPQLVRLSCVTAVDLGLAGVDSVYGCGQFSVSGIWQPTGELVDNPEELFSLSVADGAMSVGGASFGEEVTVVGYENNEFRRDYELSVPASSSGAPLRVEPTVSYGSLKTMLRFRGNGSVPVGYEGTAAHLFKDAFLFLKGVHGGSAVGVSHASGFSVAFERETDSFFGSYGSGSYKFGDTNKVVASFDREFDINGTYGLGVKVAAAYGEMEPAISLVKSAKGTAKSAGVSLARRKGNFESRVEMNYNTGLKGTVSVQRREYDLKPLSEAAVMLKMRFVM